MKWPLKIYIKLISVCRYISRGRLGKWRFLLLTKSKIERLVAGSDYALINVHNHQMYVKCDGIGISGCAAYNDNTFEAYMSKIFISVLQPGNIVLDIGASLGYYSLLAARQVGNHGRVYAFEAAPSEFDLLVKNVKLNGYSNVIPIQKAVTNSRGFRTFYLTEYVGFHTMYPDVNSHHTWRKIEVEGTSIDEFFGKQTISVIKMDIEGGESFAIKGCEQTIRGSENLKLFVEFNSKLLSSAGTPPESFINQLRSLDLDIFVIDEDRYRLIPYTDELLLNREFVEKGWNLFCEKHKAKI